MIRLLYIFLLTATFFGIEASREVACKCNNKTVQAPECGICGSDSGRMEKTATGVSCFCENDLKYSESGCEEVCADHGGWSGEFANQ